MNIANCSEKLKLNSMKNIFPKNHESLLKIVRPLWGREYILSAAGFTRGYSYGSPSGSQIHGSVFDRNFIKAI